MRVRAERVKSVKRKIFKWQRKKKERCFMEDDYEKEEKEYEEEDEESHKEMDYESDYDYDQHETTGVNDLNEEFTIEEKVFQCKKCKKEIIERGKASIIPFCPKCGAKMTLISRTKRKIGETGAVKKGKKK